MEPVMFVTKFQEETLLRYSIEIIDIPKLMFVIIVSPTKYHDMT